MNRFAKCRAASLLVATAIVTMPSLASAAMPTIANFDGIGRSSLMVAAAYSRLVEQLQRELQRAGYAPGPVDGLMGSRTSQAIREYQRDNGLLVTGQPSQSLLDHLATARASGRTTEQSAAGFGVGETWELQRRLGRLGYEVDVTGRIDGRTEAAIRAYERDQGLLVTGAASAQLLDHLGESVRKQEQEQVSQRTAASADVVADIQLGLRRRGYDIDSVNGRMNAQTRAAIRDYQRARGLDVTGEPSRELAAFLAEGVERDLTSRETIRAVQQALNARGYPAGPADGVMGPSTRRAIRAFQADQKLSESGTITPALTASLGLDSQTSTTAAAPTTTNQPAPPKPEEFTLRFSDDFDDGDYLTNPRWRVLASEFRVENGALVSNVETRVSDEAIGEELLKTVLGTALGVSLGSQPKTAAITQPTPFSGGFTIAMDLTGDPDDRSRINLGPYQADNASKGYRLVYDSAANQSLALTAVGDDGIRTLASTSKAPRLGSGEFHSLEWTRDAEGMMTVKIGGDVYLQVRDTSLGDKFQGFSLINAGGEWRVDEVTVRSPS